MKPSMMISAAGIVLLSVGAASAAPGVTTSDLNVRKGQGTNYGVIAVIPGGSQVNVTGCGDGWCYVHEYRGFASANYIDAASQAYAGYVPGNRLSYPQRERFFGPPAADYAYGRNWGTSYYVPGNRLRYPEPGRFFGPPAAEYRGKIDRTAEAGWYFPGNRLEYRRPYRFFGPEPRYALR